MKTDKFNVSGMTCAACQANVTKCVSALDCTENVYVNLMSGVMNVSYDENSVTADTICASVSAIGYPTSLQSKKTKESFEKDEWKRRSEQTKKSKKC